MFNQERRKEKLVLLSADRHPPWYLGLSGTNEALISSCRSPIETSLLFYEWMRALQALGMTGALHRFFGLNGLHDLMSTADRNPGDAIRLLMVFESHLALNHGHGAGWRKTIRRCYELRLVQRDNNREAARNPGFPRRLLAGLLGGEDRQLVEEIQQSLIKGKIAREVEYLLGRDGLL